MAKLPKNKIVRPGAADKVVGRSSRLRKAMRTVVDALEAEKRQQAVRLFLQCYPHGTPSETAGLQRWLVKRIGKESTTKLIDAFARYPCYFCKKGVVPCDDCDGKGHLGIIPCSACLGIGIARCDFCDGAGWVSIDSVPNSLRPAVVVERAGLAITRLKTLLDRPKPKPSSRSSAAGLARCGKLLLELNRNMGVLENTVIALKQFQQAESMPRRKIGGLLKACVSTAIVTETRIRQTLESMTVLVRVAGTTAKPNSPESRIAFKKAELYESLSESETYTGTSLERPFLAKAVTEILKKARARSTGENVRGKAPAKGKTRRGKPR